MTKPIIEAVRLAKSYEEDGSRVDAVRAIDLQIYKGDFVSIVGPSGSGKSTLLNLIGGLATPTSGTISVAGQNLASLCDDDLAAVRRDQIGFIFQAFNLIEVLSVEENIRLPATLARLGEADTSRRVDALLDKVGLTDHRSKRPAQLSGGERQRVAIARALMLGPAVLLADEPTGNLDSVTGQQIIGHLHDLHRDGQTVVIVTHDIKIAGTADRLFLMRDGQLAEHERREYAEDMVEVIDRLMEPN